MPGLSRPRGGIEMPLKSYGTMGVDWEQRVDYDRLRKERLARAKDALAKYVDLENDGRSAATAMLGAPVPVVFFSSPVLRPESSTPLSFTVVRGIGLDPEPVVSPVKVSAAPACGEKFVTV